jgi:PleD family two-component response regulator
MITNPLVRYYYLTKKKKYVYKPNCIASYLQAEFVKGFLFLKAFPNWLTLGMSFLLNATINILLADDDKDDTELFKEVLEELPFSIQLETVYNGEQLMQVLNQEQKQLPDVLFLDLNMPRKSGLECFSEIKENEKLQ